jgi:hypothetical protein
MRGHLTDAEMTVALGGDAGAEVRAHLAACPACLTERDRLRAALSELAEQARVQAERSEAAWEGQRLRIAARLSDRSPLSEGRPRGWRWAWAPVAVGLAALALLWWRGETPRLSPGADADHALLIAVERSVQAEVPVALRPVALLAAEIEPHGTDTERGPGTPTGDRP